MTWTLFKRNVRYNITSGCFVTSKQISCDRFAFLFELPVKYNNGFKYILYCISLDNWLFGRHELCQ